MARCLTLNESRNLWIVRTFNENRSPKESYSWHYDDEDFTMCGSWSPFRGSLNRFYRIVGSCEGVLCLADDRPIYLKDLTLWNPAIGRWLRLPPAENAELGKRFIQKMGLSSVEVEHIVSFGYDALSCDYKVIRIVYLATTLLKVVLYTLSSGTWKDISHLADDLKDLNIKGENQVFLREAVHWIAIEKEIDRSIILCFSMGKEAFHRIEAPTSLPFASLSIIEGSLSVVAMDSYMEKCSIWRMNEYGVASSWAKHLVIDRSFDSILGFRINGELLVECSGSLHSYNPQNKKLKSLGVESNSGFFGKSLQAERFSGSCVLSELGLDIELELEKEMENMKTKKEKEERKEEKKEQKKEKKMMYRILALASRNKSASGSGSARTTDNKNMGALSETSSLKCRLLTSDI